MGLLGDTRQNVPQETDTEKVETGEIDMNDIDDNEIDSYIMSEQEATNKDSLWMKVNAQYLKELQEKEEKAKRDQEEGKPEKKKRKPSNKKGKGPQGGPCNSSGEAVQKMLQEKKMSSKLNYDVLKNLTGDLVPDLVPVIGNSPSATQTKRERLDSTSDGPSEERAPKVVKTEKAPRVATVVRRGKNVKPVLEAAPATPAPPAVAAEDQDEAEDFEEEVEDEQPEGSMSLSQLLNKHRGDDDCYGEDYDYDEY